MKEIISVLHKKIREYGYAYQKSLPETELKHVLDSFGSVIQITDVTVKSTSRALVTSAKALDFHTDHHKADFVAWHCVEQTDEGGESILVDAVKVFSEMTDEDKSQLAKIHLHEHKIFEDDKDSWPLVELENGQPKFYYSFWLLKEKMNLAERAAGQRFQQLIQQTVPIKIKLQPSDFLIVDNRRILHGRTEIKGNQKRLLKRFWIAKN